MCDPTEEKEQAFQQAKQYRINELERQLAAAELSNKQLRDVIRAVEVVGMHYEESSNIYFTCPECEFNQASDSSQVKHADNCMIAKSLAQQPSTEALAEYVAKLIPDVDWLANIIRQVDGDHSLGAGSLAEKIIAAMKALPPAPKE